MIHMTASQYHRISGHVKNNLNKLFYQSCIIVYTIDYLFNNEIMIVITNNNTIIMMRLVVVATDNDQD